MTRYIYHITQRPDGRWEGRRQGFSRVSILNADRHVVEERIRALAAKNNFTVVVHEPREVVGSEEPSTGKGIPLPTGQEA
ncbi:MAG: hypothetical protein ACO1NQ_02330 [Flavobacteriales bacterium]